MSQHVLVMVNTVLSVPRNFEHAKTVIFSRHFFHCALLSVIFNIVTNGQLIELLFCHAFVVYCVMSGGKIENISMIMTSTTTVGYR